MGGRGGSSHRATGGGGNLQNLTTVDQVNQWLRNQNWFAPYSRVSLNGIDIAAARGIAEAYKQVFDRYPQLKGFFNGVVSFSLGSGTYADCNLSSGTVRVSDSIGDFGRIPYESSEGNGDDGDDDSRLTLHDFIYSTYNSLLEDGWRMKEIDEMDMPGFLRIRAWSANREKAQKAPKARFIDEVWGNLKP